MYSKNNYKNTEITDIDDLDAVLLIFADAEKDISLYALGGTAMVLGKLKETTKDIDFLTTASHEEIQKILGRAEFKERQPSEACNIWEYENRIRIDFFYHGFILGITLPDDWERISTHIKNIGKLKLYSLNWYDIIITKIARSEQRDIEDILLILKKEKIDFKKLKDRYYGLGEVSIISDYDVKFRHLERLWRQRN